MELFVFCDGLYRSCAAGACRKSDRESKLLTTSLKSTGQNKFAIEEKEVCSFLCLCVFAHMLFSVFTFTFGLRFYALGDL